MAVSSTNDFNLNIEQIIEKAFEWVGGELTSGEDLKKARNSLDLLLIDMQNRGHPLAELENKTFTVSEGVNSKVLDSGVLDVLSVVVTRDGSDTPVKRIPLFEYHKISDKDSKGLPSQFAIDRDRNSTTMFLYQSPENSTDVIDYWAITRIADAGNYTNNVDLDARYLPAVTFGLAYFLSLGRTGIDPVTRRELRQNYVDTLDAAQLEDRERVSFKVTPPTYHRKR